MAITQDEINLFFTVAVVAAVLLPLMGFVVAARRITYKNMVGRTDQGSTEWVHD